MTRDDIIRMAREAGLAEWHPSIEQDGFRFADPERLERFANLVAAAEREACAKVCEETDLVEYEHCMVLHTDGHATLRNAAVAIRARGEK